MSDEKQPENPKDVPLKVLSKEILTKQVTESQKYIEIARQQVARLNREIEQQIGVLGYSEHLLKQFDIPSVPEQPKKDLEVK